MPYPCGVNIPRQTHNAGGMAGVSLLEMGFVVLIIGLIVGLGVVSMHHMLANARLSKTQTVLQQCKDCLRKRAVYNNRYPTFAPGGVSIDCDVLSYDVNACLCGGNGSLQDAWGEKIRFIEGVDQHNAGLKGGMIVNLTQQSAPTTAPGPMSLLMDHRNAARRDVAFILISSGKDRALGDSSYGALFKAGNCTATLAPEAPPNFSSPDNDDLFLLVTGKELRAAVRE